MALRLLRARLLSHWWLFILMGIASPISEERTYMDNQFSDHSPYLNHLIDVTSLLVKFGHDDEDLLISAVLNDAVEDTTVNYDQLILMFGEEVADSVKGLSDDRRLSLQERRLGQLKKLKMALETTS